MKLEFRLKRKPGRPKLPWYKRPKKQVQPKTRTNIRVPNEVYSKVKAIAEKKDQTIISYIVRAIKVQLAIDADTLVEQADIMQYVDEEADDKVNAFIGEEDE